MPNRAQPLVSGETAHFHLRAHETADLSTIFLEIQLSSEGDYWEIYRFVRTQRHGEIWRASISLSFEPGAHNLSSRF
jgi:hypothetical protein